MVHLTCLNYRARALPIMAVEVDVKHVVILAHPNRHSFNGTLAAAYSNAAKLIGDQVLLRDLYGLDFKPVLQVGELPFGPHFSPGEDVVAERALIADADVYALVYPLWLNAPPAMMKGYLERVFGYGFAYGKGGGGSEPLLTDKKLISITTSGAPTRWLHETGGLEAVRVLFDRHFAEVCGLTVVDHLHFGGIVPGIRDDAVERMADDVAGVVRKHFKNVK